MNTGWHGCRAPVAIDADTDLVTSGYLDVVERACLIPELPPGAHNAAYPGGRAGQQAVAVGDASRASRGDADASVGSVDETRGGHRYARANALG